MECRIIKSGHSPKKDYTVPTPKVSTHSNLNISSYVSKPEQEMEYDTMSRDAGL